MVEKNDQRDDFDEVMTECGGDEEKDGESEDDNEDGHGGGGVAKRSGTRRRKLRSFYFRTGTVVRTTTDNGRDVTAQCQVGGLVDYKKILSMSNGGTQVVQSHFLKCHTELNVMIRGLQNTVGADQDPPHFLKLLTTEKPHTVAAGGVMNNLLKSMERGSKLLTGSAKQRLDKVIVQQDLPLHVCEADTMHDFLLEVSQGRYKGVSRGTVRAIVTEMAEEGKEQTKIL